MTVETHEVAFSFDQPGDMRNPLLSILQQLLNRPLAKDSRATALLGAQRVLVVDSQQERAQYIAHLISSAGYWPFVAPTPLDAYTLFLQGTFHPFAIILSEDSSNTQFFLNRLSQQFLQRYDWKVPFIRLRMPASDQFAPRSTEPLAQQQFPRTRVRQLGDPGSSFPGSSRPSSPLSQPGEPGPRFNRSSSPLSLPEEPGQRFAPSSSLLGQPGELGQRFNRLSSPLSQPGELGQRSNRLSSPLGQPGEPGQRFAPPSSPLGQPGQAPWQQASSAQPSDAGHRPAASSQPLTRLRSSSTPLQPPSASSPLSLSAPEAFHTPNGSATPTPRRLIPPSAGVNRSSKQQVEKISLDGLSIGRYQLKSILGGSPIGDVYLTYDRLREQDIVLKTIQTNMIPFHLIEGQEDDYNLFQQEWDLLQKIEHPHLARVMNLGKSYISGFPFIYKTMPYYTEGSLQSWIGQFSDRFFAPSDVARVILQLADALQFLHTRGVLYQNFKQTNILITNETQTMRDLHVVLSDMPFVRDVMNLPKTNESYRYYAPEQWDSEAFTSSDQYGLAVVAYELLTGRAPFQGNSDAIMRRMHLTMPTPAPSSFNRQIYPFVDKVLLRALSKRPSERFESVQAFAAALERASN
jgi:hypothetical protein